MKSLIQKSHADESSELQSIAIWHGLLRRDTSVIANELHNNLAQVLLALRLDLALFQLQYQSDQTLMQRTSGWLAMADQGMQSLSSLINTIHVPDFNQGLVNVLEYLTQNLFHRYQLPCQFIVNCECAHFEQLQVMLIFRLVYEALNNIVKHAQANVARVTLTQLDPDSIILEISDDGIGFDLSTINTEKTLGWLLMREYAQDLGGQLRIESKINSGTTVSLTLPIPQQKV